MNLIKQTVAKPAQPAHTTLSNPSAKTNLLVDGVIGIGLLAVLSPALTGLAVHEWLSLALMGGVLVHLLLHWNWMASVTRRFLRALTAGVRVNAIINGLLFVAFVVAMLSGILISEAVLVFFGMQGSRGGIWRQLHSLSANAMLLLGGLHVALHWRWLGHTLASLWRLPSRRKEAVPTMAKGELS